jgi:hypothetical protein
VQNYIKVSKYTRKNSKIIVIYYIFPQDWCYCSLAAHVTFGHLDIWTFGISSTSQAAEPILNENQNENKNSNV